MKFNQILLLCICMCFPIALSAQNKIVTVKDCVSLALQNNPMIRMAIEEENRSLASYRIVQSSDSLNVNFGFAPVPWDFITKTNPTNVT